MTKRTLDHLEAELRAVVRGEREPSPAPESPPRSMLSVVAANLTLMKAIAEVRPASVSELANATGRAQSNVSRSLQDLARYGLVRLVRDGKIIRPELAAGHVDVDLKAGRCVIVPSAEAAE